MRFIVALKGIFSNRENASDKAKAMSTEMGVELDVFDYAPIVPVDYAMCCDKCGARAPGDWSQCQGDCPLTVSPYHFTNRAS